MRALTGLLVLAALAAVPSSVHAQAPMCDFTGGADMVLQGTLAPYLAPVAAAGTTTASGGEADAAARSVLGAQFGRIWLDQSRAGWSVAFSPGVHDAVSARAAIRDALAARLDAATVAYLDSTLRLLPTPYSLAELDAVLAQLAPLMAPYGIAMVGCQWSDGLRVEASFYDPETPALRAAADGLLAQFGDRVRVRFGVGRGSTLIGTVPAEAVQQRPTPKVREYVSLPKTSRCVKGGAVSAKPRAGLGVERVRLQIGKRSASARGGKAARLQLKSKRSTVTVTVFVKDAVPVAERLTYRRCA